MEKDTVAILGTGNVGTAVGVLLRNAGYPITAISDRDHASAARGAEFTGGRVYDSVSEAASQATCIIISTPDDIIESVCNQIADSGAVRSGAKVIHLSGAGGCSLLAAAHRMGAHVAAIHPIQTFANIQSAISSIPGSTFGITADREIEAWAFQLVRDIGGNPFSVSESDRPLYHAAACIASNYFVALMHVAESIYRKFGLDSEEALRACWPLVEGTMRNIRDKGTTKALTGPVARGDIGTILKHLEAIQKSDPSYLQLYRTMGLLTADLALEKGTLSKEKADELKHILQENTYE
jgi:predicted short-subunit dehydrogenase-like oxidoreductase (DUF2520 family)